MAKRLSPSGTPVPDQYSPEYITTATRTLTKQDMISGDTLLVFRAASTLSVPAIGGLKEGARVFLMRDATAPSLAVTPVGSATVKDGVGGALQAFVVYQLFQLASGDWFLSP